MPQGETSQAPFIYEYLDYRVFIQDYVTYRRQRNPTFTLQALSKEISPELFRSSLLYAILKGKRKVSSSLRPKMARAMQLKDKEAQYFEFLVQFDQAKNSDEKNHYFQRLSQFHNSKAKIIGENQYKFFSRWYYPVIWNYFGMNQKEKSPSEIAKRLFPPVTASEVEDSIRLLLDLRLIKKMANGFAVTENHLTTDRVFLGMVAKQYNRHFIDMAASLLEIVPKEHRQYNTLVVTLSPDGFSTLKERMRSFQREIQGIVDRDQGADKIFAFCMQLFPTIKLK